jgi:putative transposase
MEVEVIAIKCYNDHTHLFLGALPQLSPSDIVGRIKHESSTKLRLEFKELSRAVSLWTRSFFVSTSYDTPDTTIATYINEQKKRG